MISFGILFLCFFFFGRGSGKFGECDGSYTENAINVYVIRVSDLDQIKDVIPHCFIMIKD